MEIEKVGVVGCGVMGSGICQVCAQSGYDVVVSEANDELLNKGLALIDAALSRRVSKGDLSQQDKDTTIKRIKGTTNAQDFSTCNLVIEAASERIEVKKSLFTNLDSVCPADTILATNTSCISIINIAMATKRPEKVLGLHFFNPAPLMKLIEVIKTIATSEETLEESRHFSESLGKTPIIVQDSPGFIVNRLLVPYLLSAVRMLESGIATKEDIDTAINLGLSHPIGPLALSDLIGLDVLLFIAESMYDELKDPQCVPPILLQKMVTAGWLGRKTGKGFYEYK